VETLAEVMQAQGLVYQLVLMIHVLLFVYWLGGDLGVFYSSGFLIRPELSRETRLVTAKIMFNLDLVPRICMSLMLTVGGILTEAVGIVHPSWQMAGIILLGPVWLSMVLFLDLREGTEVREFYENLAFTPWHSLEAHKPVGEINLARKFVYLASSMFRHEANGISYHEPNGPKPGP